MDDELLTMHELSGEKEKTAADKLKEYRKKWKKQAKSLGLTVKMAYHFECSSREFSLIIRLLRKSGHDEAKLLAQDLLERRIQGFEEIARQFGLEFSVKEDD